MKKGMRKRSSHQKAPMAAIKQAASIAIQQSNWRAAQLSLDQAEPAPGNSEDPQILKMQAQIYHGTGQSEAAITLFKKALQLEPNQPECHYYLSLLYTRRFELTVALKHAKAALELAPSVAEFNFQLGNVLQLLDRKTEALEVMQELLKKAPNDSRYWNNTGTIYSSVGKREQATECFRNAMQLDSKNIEAFANYIIFLHYDPNKTRDEIYNSCMLWQEHHESINSKVHDHIEKSPDKKLNIGMISDGFHSHPVGQMIISSIEKLPKQGFNLHCYTNSEKSDHITDRFKNISTFNIVGHLNNEGLSEKISNDKIDILIDLAGYNRGTRMPALALKPSPVIVKWVGGLINTCALDTIDYLISDNIETPDGEDRFYTERLIRMPGDYICYDPPLYAPEVKNLPALKNNAITFGCFNNPMKINDTVLKNWSEILHAVKKSRIFLKGSEYSTKELKDEIIKKFEQFGIDQKRIIMEGFSPHNELLECYNRIDIALDPWPYSGGLTTCEALLMGVPVVTMPGPTFAGRHSATHLVNAGMPELVTHSWDEYRARVIELASDLDSLATIRSHLRTILLQSPVCDADAFAAHLNNALRAIWQRYCEGKQPEALSFNEQGEVLFADETEPMQLQHPEAPEPDDNSEFKWEFQGKVIAIDHGGQLMDMPTVKQMLDLGTLELIEFDPASNYLKHPLRQHKSVHYYPNVALGDGQPATLYACQAPERSGTLKPAPHEYMPEKLQQELNVLAELPIGTVALDKVSELPSVDWLVLDDLNDAALILENGEATLEDTLLIHVKLAFQPTHIRQPNFAEVAHWASRNGFRFYCFSNHHESTPVPQSVIGANRYADELIDAGAIFIPDHKRMELLDSNKKKKLAFLSHSIYGYKGLGYEVLSSIDQSLADGYMQYNTERLENQLRPHVPQKGRRIKPTIASLSLSDENKPKQPSIVADSMDWDIKGKINVVDIGANPIDGTPPYKGLLDRGYISLIGFEPQKEALKKLNIQKGPDEKYLPYAVGDGTGKILYLCQAEGMTSTLEPNFELLNHFQGYPDWAKVKQKLNIDTYRLDDIDEVPPIDWLKIDIQGGELAVFKNAEEKLKNCLVIQTEVNFIPLYKDQPLFAEIDQWMRAHGFMLHTLLEQRIRLFAPMVINNQIHQGINQLTTADAVYIKDFSNIKDNDRLLKLACIMHEAYGSYDLSFLLLNNATKTKHRSLSISPDKYLKRLKKNSIEINKKTKTAPSTLENVFIVGCGHTGTTLMATILGSHSKVRTIERETSWFLGNKNVFEQEYNKEASTAIKEGKSHICEKTPRHLYKINEISKIFEGAKFIIMVRNPLDVTASLKRRSGNFDSALKRCFEDQSTSISFKEKPNTLIVHYEDLVNDTKKTLQEACHFLNLDYESDMMSYHEKPKEWFGIHNPTETDGIGEKNHIIRRAWQMNQPIKNNNGKWKEILTEKEQGAVLEKCKIIFSGLGYTNNGQNP
jgi:FkbM family methyltransferase